MTQEETESIEPPQLITIQLNPDNRETPINFIGQQSVINSQFFRRNHFDYPIISTNYLTLIPLQNQPKIVIDYQSILKMPSRKVDIVLECAGNRRNKFKEKASGIQWGPGAVSYGVWKGVSLNKILSNIDISSSKECEVIFTGHDFGLVIETGNKHYFQRSLPLEKALDDDTIIAYEYNNQPITKHHGFPMRLIVPGWYGISSVKWLKSIQVIDKKFVGPFQTQYTYTARTHNNFTPFPVTTINVNSLIQHPLDQSKHQINIPIEINGIAYTGEGNISNVEISFNNTNIWYLTTLRSEPNTKYSWRSWLYKFIPILSGTYIIKIRASDTKGRIQPEFPMPNIENYGYNAISTITISVI